MWNNYDCMLTGGHDVCKQTAVLQSKGCYNVELIALQLRCHETSDITAFLSPCVVFGNWNILRNIYDRNSEKYLQPYIFIISNNFVVIIYNEPTDFLIIVCLINSIIKYIGRYTIQNLLEIWSNSVVFVPDKPYAFSVLY